MTRRLVLISTTAAVLATGAGIASATTTHSTTHSAARPGSMVPAHQLCLLIYRDSPTPQHLCINW